MKVLCGFLLALYATVALPVDYGVVFVGDTGMPGSPQTKVAQAMEGYCKANPCDVGLLLGDNFYPMGVKDVGDSGFKQKFEDAYKNLKFRFFAVLGNHDVYGNADAQIQYKSEHWSMPSRWFSFDGPVVSIMGIDTNYLMLPHEELIWLKQQFYKSSKMPWRIVYGHHPIYSSGDHGDNFGLKLQLELDFIAGDVDFYLTGHDHDKELAEVHGVKHVVCGAGSKVRPLKPKGRSEFGAGTYGFCHLKLSDKTAVLRMIDDTGKIEFEKTYTKP